MMSNKEENQAQLHWASSNAKQPCYCTVPFGLDITRIVPTPLMISHLFAIPDASSIKIYDSNENEVEFINGLWKLETQQDYYVYTNDPIMDSVRCVNEIYPLFPGTTDEEKQDSMQALSNKFYDLIWHSPKTPETFKDKFVNKFSSAEIQAYRQYNWFAELFGGPSLYVNKGDGEKYLKPKTMAKHPPTRMSLDYSITWLKLMKESLDDVFPNENEMELKRVLGIYWLHFFAWFPYTDEERNQLVKLI